MNKKDAQKGMAMIEYMIAGSMFLLIVVSLGLTYIKQNILKAKDAQRKEDLVNIRNGIEGYYGPNSCYPPIDTFTRCGSNELTPHLSKIPCDPIDDSPYEYLSDDPQNLCQSGYRICAHLDNAIDPDIRYIGCSAVNGCGWGDKWNYCVAVGTSVTKSGFVPQAGP